jgi:hypothetical protein
VILGGITAIDKVGSFLLSLAGRASETKGQVELPVSRYDIADYLAVSVETVCRSITDLQHRGVITLAGNPSHRLQGIAHQVDQDLLNFNSVRHDVRRFGIQKDADLYPRGRRTD